jgi:putative ABC transport system substrate-binding protein
MSRLHQIRSDLSLGLPRYTRAGKEITMWFKPIRLVVALALVILTAPLAVDAQPPPKVYRIGWLSAGSPLPELDLLLDAFRQGLHDLGYVEGQNLVIEGRYAEDRYERFADLVTELVRLKVDVIVTGASPAIQAAKHATETIPIVFVTLVDPEVLGFVASLAQPGGNLTGFAGLPVELSSKRLEILKEALPSATRVAVLANPANPMMARLWRETERAARDVGVQLHLLEVRAPHEVDIALATLTSARADAVLTLQDPMLNRQRRRIVELAAQHRLPVIGAEAPNWAEASGLMAYGPNQPDLYRRVAVYVDKILKGTKPGELPIERPIKFELVINLQTAKALGLMVSPSLLLQADRVIQ